MFTEWYICFAAGMTCFTGKAEGYLYEDAGEGTGSCRGTISRHIMLSMSSHQWFLWKFWEVKRNLNIVLLGGGAMVCLLVYFLFITPEN